MLLLTKLLILIRLQSWITTATSPQDSKRQFIQINTSNTIEIAGADSNRNRRPPDPDRVENVEGREILMFSGYRQPYSSYETAMRESFRFMYDLFQLV